ncbi:MAG: peptidoglycan DD-metalloendopeptidase family protein, partial [Pseudomonadales bacterium]
MPRSSRILAVSCFLTVTYLSTSALAADVYKYQDEKGNWHFSERTSGHHNEQKYETRSSSEKKMFKDVWVKEHSGTRPALSVINKYHGPIQAMVHMECTGCKDKVKTANIVVAANSKELARRFELSKKRFSIKYKLHIVLGDPDAIPDEDFIYRLPFPELMEYQVTQSFNGPFSHQDDLNLHAIDVAMPIATPVLAARSGTIMAVEESYTEAGTDVAFSNKSNTVYVLHDDGSIGVYAHLDMFSVRVNTGDVVKMGDLLARSGNTGFSTGPH